MLKNILFPTDGSPSSTSALNYVKELAQKFGAKVTVLHTYELLGQIAVYETSYAYLQELEDYLMDQSKQITSSVEKQLTDAGLEVYSRVLKGDPGVAIVEVAAEEKCDAIVMGSRGLGAVQRFLLGSVSNYVVHHSKCPVMIIPTPH